MFLGITVESEKKCKHLWGIKNISPTILGGGRMKISNRKKIPHIFDLK